LHCCCYSKKPLAFLASVKISIISLTDDLSVRTEMFDDDPMTTEGNTYYRRVCRVQVFG